MLLLCSLRQGRLRGAAAPAPSSDRLSSGSSLASLRPAVSCSLADARVHGGGERLEASCSVSRLCPERKGLLAGAVALFSRCSSGCGTSTPLARWLFPLLDPYAVCISLRGPVRPAVGRDGSYSTLSLSRLADTIPCSKGHCRRRGLACGFLLFLVLWWEMHCFA